jgi:hypothetical protein
MVSYFYLPTLADIVQVPSPHPALDASKSFLPELKAFLQHGDGLGITTPTYKNWNLNAVVETGKQYFAQDGLSKLYYQISKWYTSNEALNVALGFCFWSVPWRVCTGLARAYALP